ncbi:MAG: NCS2 family permease, partial [Lachnospiraceae bacterium]|nr:NCS2 family permease [Lachnospiraceae bacterium]
MEKTYRPFVRADIDAFFGLFVDNLANILVLATTLTGVIKMPHEIVYGRVLPGFAIAVLAASVYYFFQAIRVAKKQGLTDVCALPFGAPTTALFGFLYSIILPVYLISGDPMTAWRVGVAACLINGIIEILGAFFGETIRKITPRAALFGSLAGIAIAFIALKPTMQVFSLPQVGFLPFAIILLGLIAKEQMPANLPVGLL